MRKEFDIPEFYRSNIISIIKKKRNTEDRFRKDLSPTVLNLGDLIIKIPRHFGFCYGVENAIQIAYDTINENPGKNIYLISEMIHNPYVNNDLNKRGIRFLMKTDGTQIIPFEEIQKDDIVIIPAFGISLEVLQKIKNQNPEIKIYNTTCPFVEKVWHRAEQLGKKGYTIVIHGRYNHEETKATFSHARIHAPAIVIEDKKEAYILTDFILEKRTIQEFFDYFQFRISDGFQPAKHLQRIGVVNQTTMLATETIEISEILKKAIKEKYKDNEFFYYFADTKDTLCYATWENQSAIREMLQENADLAIIVGGYNSSNTSHLVELCEEKVPTYYIKDEQEIISRNQICHLNLHKKEIIVTNQWIPEKEKITILVSAGASCPDSLVDQVITKIASLFNKEKELEKLIDNFKN